MDLLPATAVIDACVFPHTRRWLTPITDLAHEGYVRPIWSPSIIAEANRVLTWLWVRRHGGRTTEESWQQCSAAARRMFVELTRVFRVVDDCPPAASLWTDDPADEWDAPLWTAAVRAGADFIVTENLRDGPPAGPDRVQEHDGILVVHPADFLALIDSLAERDPAAEMPQPSNSGADLSALDRVALYRRALAGLRAPR